MPLSLIHIYVVINLFLIAINWFTSPHYWWVLMALAASVAFFPIQLSRYSSPDDAVINNHQIIHMRLDIPA